MQLHFSILAPPTYDAYEQSNTTKSYEIEYDPDDIDLSYDEAYIRAPIPDSPATPADATSTSVAAVEVETTTTPTQNQNTTTETAN